MRCPNTDCPYAKKHGRAAEYRAGIATCTDCGAALVSGDAPSSSAAVGGGAGVGAGASRDKTRAAAVVVSVLAALLAPALTFLPLPYIDLDMLRDYMHGATGGYFDRSALALDWVVPSVASVGSIGFRPWITAFGVVELAALLVPGLRKLRHGGPEGRATLTRASTTLGVFLAIAQAWLLVGSLANIGNYAVGSIAPDLVGMGPKLVVVATIVAGTCMVRIAAAIVERAGVGSAFSVLMLGEGAALLVSMALRVVNRAGAGIITPTYALVTTTVVAVAAFSTWMYLRPRPLHASTKPRGDDDHDDGAFFARPTSGFIPLVFATQLPALLATAFSFTSSRDPFEPSGVASIALVVVPALVLIPLCARWLSSPQRAAIARAKNAGAAAASADDVEKAQEAWRRALPATIAFQVVVLGAYVLGVRLGAGVDVFVVIVCTAVVRDLLVEMNARRAHGPLVAVWPLHRFDHVELAVGELRKGGVVDVHVRGAHHRVLLHFFGPFVPLEILVRPDDADKARGVLASFTGRVA